MNWGSGLAARAMDCAAGRPLNQRLLQRLAVFPDLDDGRLGSQLAAVNALHLAQIDEQNVALAELFARVDFREKFWVFDRRVERNVAMPSCTPHLSSSLNVSDSINSMIFLDVVSETISVGVLGVVANIGLLMAIVRKTKFFDLGRRPIAARAAWYHAD